MNQPITPLTSPVRALQLSLLGVAFSLLATPGQAGAPMLAPAKQPVPTIEQAVNWKDHTLNPVMDPIVFEDAIIRSEIRPVMGHQHIGNDFATQGGDLQVYGLQFRWAFTDRMALIFSKGGYNFVDPGAGPDLEGWGDLQVGLKYALIDDPANQFILTPGLLFEIPSGNREVFQGRGSGIWNPFISAEKGFGKFHLLANVGVMVPNDTDANSTIIHYHLQADYHCSRWFHPFIGAHGYTSVSDGNSFPFNTEGLDLVNFGSANASGSTQLTLGGGFRSHLTKWLDFGFSYEKAVVKPYGLLDDRYTIDFVIYF